MEKRGRPKKNKQPEIFAKKRICTPNKMVIDHGAKCPHCGNLHGHKITNTYSNGNRRAKCGNCAKPMIIRRVKKETL